MYLIVHHSDADGYVAALIVSKYLEEYKEAKKEDITFLEVYSKDHDTVFPNETYKDKHVYIVDFSFPLAEMERIRSIAASLLLIDHHESAYNELKGLGYCVIDKSFSGCGLAWDYFFGADEKEVPKLVQYVQDRDIWTWKLPYSKEINAFIGTYKLTIETCEALLWKLEEGFYRAIDIGNYIIRRDNELIARASKNAYRIDWEEYKDIPVINSCLFQSELGHNFCSNSSFAIIWYYDGEFYHYSFRSSGEINCSELARRFCDKYGGNSGGHIGASGLTTKTSITEITKGKINEN